METLTLTDLGPVLAAVLGPMLLFVVASMRYQHVDSTKTRDLIELSNKENRDLIEGSNEKNRDLIEKSYEKSRDLIEQSNKENRDLIEKNHRELSGSLGEVRERLAHIEDYLRLSPPPPYDDGNAEAA